MAFASARLMALRRLVAGRALDFEQDLCSICTCVSQEKVEIHFIFSFSIILIVMNKIVSLLYLLSLISYFVVHEK